MQTSSPHLSLNDKDVFLKELRAVTGPAHKRLEELPLSKAIVSSDLSLRQYALYLAKMQAFVTSFEQELFPLLTPAFSDLPQRVKAIWLKSDLTALHNMGVTVPQVPAFRFRPGLSLPFLAGALYVLEGSTLGGKFIYKNIHSTLQLDAGSGACYFNGYGTETGRQWSGFIEQLCNYATHKNKNNIFNGADKTFQLMFDLLSE